MKSFEYAITRHSAEEFPQIVYFCSEQGECNLSQLPSNQIDSLKEVLNEKGAEGWELVHMSFGNEGLLAFWKKEKIIFDQS